MKSLIQCAIVLLAMGVNAAGAQDLFPDRKPRKIESSAELLAPGTTMGGYPLYMGGRSWYLLKSKVDINNLDIPIASAHLISPVEQAYFAEMYMVASIGGASQEGYFSADLCNPGKPHLFMLNKGVGRNDNCLLIDPLAGKISGVDTTLFLINVRNSQSSWRLYDLSMFLSLNKMGFPGTTAADWTEAAVALDPKKKQFVAKVAAWARQLQDSVNTAIAFSKPQNAFDTVPDIQTLMDAK